MVPYQERGEIYTRTFYKYLPTVPTVPTDTVGTVGTIHTKKGARGLKNAAVERRRAAALSYHAD